MIGEKLLDGKQSCCKLYSIFFLIVFNEFLLSLCQLSCLGSIDPHTASSSSLTPYLQGAVERYNTFFTGQATKHVNPNEITEMFPVSRLIMHSECIAVLDVQLFAPYLPLLFVSFVK